MSGRESDHQYILEKPFELLRDLLGKIVRNDTENRLRLRNASCVPGTVLRAFHPFSYSVFRNTHGLSTIIILILLLGKLDLER